MAVKLKEPQNKGQVVEPKATNLNIKRIGVQSLKSNFIYEKSSGN